MINLDQKSFQKRTLLKAGVVIFVFLLIAFIVVKTRDSGAQFAKASVSSFDIKVNTVGVLDAARSQMITSNLKGDRGKVIFLVNDGNRVNQGDILVKLDPAPFEEEVLRLTGEMRSREAAVRALEQVLEWEKSELYRQIETTEYNLRIALLELEKVQNGEGPLQLAQLKTDMDKAKQEYTRYTSYLRDLEDLERKGYGNPMEIAQAKEKIAQFKEAHETAKEKYNSFKNYVFPSMTETANAKIERSKMEKEQTKKEGVFKVAKAVAELDRAKREFETAKAKFDQSQGELGKTIIRAPISGIAILNESFYGNQKRKPRIGDTVLQGQPLLYLPDVSSMVVRTDVREVDIHKLALGQKASVQVDAYPDLIFHGDVTAIGVIASEKFEGGKGEKYFQITISLKGEEARLRPGMTSRVSINIATVKDVLNVPVPAIFTDSGKKYCYVYSGNTFRKVEVSVGSQNEDTAEIISGLKTGDKISLIRPGAESAR